MRAEVPHCPASLVVEDERKVRHSLERGFAGGGATRCHGRYRRRGVPGLAAGLFFDCVVLDLMPPDATASKCSPTCAASRRCRS